jgi:hypothetical protein
VAWHAQEEVGALRGTNRHHTTFCGYFMLYSSLCALCELCTLFELNGSADADGIQLLAFMGFGAFLSLASPSSACATFTTWQVRTARSPSHVSPIMAPIAFSE